MAQIARADITSAECSAMRLLATDGYDHDELAMLFECSTSCVSKHLNNHCKIHAYNDD